MRIIYLARHGQVNSNDDEGAVAHALRQLGHEVECVLESRADQDMRKHRGDFLLFHHCRDLASVATFRGRRVYWCFDLIDYPDPTLARRCEERKKWARAAVEVCNLGFHTDGDWVAADKTGKLHWLPQGADERVLAQAPSKGFSIPILFVGMRRGGQKRESFVDFMADVYGPAFTHVERGVHGLKLQQLYGSAKIVVAPDGPVTDRYWSNRIYNALGMGAFLIHPWSRELGEQFNGMELVTYTDRSHLKELIDIASNNPQLRYDFAAAGLNLTKTSHLYRHRCAELVRTVEELLL